MNVARVRACKSRTWDPELGAWVSRVYGYVAATVDEAVGKVHGSYSDALSDVQAHNQRKREYSQAHGR